MHTVLLADITICYTVELGKVEVVVAVETIRGIEIVGALLALRFALERVFRVVEFVQGLPVRFDGIAVATIGRVVFYPPCELA